MWVPLTDRHTVLSLITRSLGEGLSKFTLMTDQDILRSSRIHLQSLAAWIPYQLGF